MIPSVLLVAQSCDERRGSEWSNGGSFVRELSAAAHVTLITDKIQHEGWDDVYGDIGTIEVLKVGPEVPEAFWRLLGRTSWQIYSAWWRRDAGRAVAALTAERRYDYVHHITPGNAWMPSPIRRSSSPYSIGPVGGADHVHGRVARQLPARPRVAEAIRGSIIRAALRYPPTRKTFGGARTVVAADQATASLLAELHHPNLLRSPQVTLNAPTVAMLRAMAKRPNTDARPFAVFCAGRMLAWKGLSIVVDAVAEARRRGCEVELVVSALGADTIGLQRHVESLGAASGTVLLKDLPREESLRAMSGADLFVHASLRDSPGIVQMEAVNLGVPTASILGGFEPTNQRGLTYTWDPTTDVEPVEWLTETILDAACHRDERRPLEEFWAVFDERYASARNFAHLVHQLGWKLEGV